MTSRVGTRRVRKAPEHRRAEIVDAAITLALRGGLDQVTLRMVADELGVTSGLVSHYFPQVETLVAEAFGTAAAAELEALWADADHDATARRRLVRLLRLLAEPERDQISALWMDAWQAARQRPAIRPEIVRGTQAWLDRLGSLFADGAAAGEFVVADPEASAKRLLAVVDGLSVQAAMRDEMDYEPVRLLLFDLAERELALEPGSLPRT